MSQISPRTLYAALAVATTKEILSQMVGMSVQTVRSRYSNAMDSEMVPTRPTSSSWRPSRRSLTVVVGAITAWKSTSISLTLMVRLWLNFRQT
jgi:hypothetical protein